MVVPNAEIAATLYMSEATVKAHASRLLTKLDVSNRVGVAILVHDAAAEFVVVCEDLDHPSAGQVLAGRLESALTAGVSVGDRMMPVPVSVGIAVGAAGSLPLDLLEEADDAMYRAKAKAKQVPGGTHA